MKWPQFMSKKFWYLKESESFDGAFEALVQSGGEHGVEFFIESCEDRTWILGGGGLFMKQIYQWLLQEYREGRLPDADANAIAQAIQPQFEALQEILEYDVDFIIEDELIPVSSFMFGAQSSFFKKLIKKAKLVRGRKTLELQKAKLSFFEYIKEFVYKGKIEFLWREEPKYILNFIRQAQKLGMDEMTAYAAGVYKRYLTPKNVIPHLRLAQREFLNPLQLECCRFVNEQDFGVNIDFRDNIGLQVAVDRITVQGLALIDFLAKQISYLICSSHVPESLEIVAILGKIPRLIGLDLSNSSGISPEFIENFPSVKQLNLSHCMWLSDELFLLIIEKCRRLVKLNLSGNTNLSFRSLGELTSLNSLSSLDLSYCDQLNDDDFDLVASSCPQLAELYLQFCRISDQGLEVLRSQCAGLAVLDLTDCKNVTEEGIEKIKSALPRLKLRFGGLDVE